MNILVLAPDYPKPGHPLGGAFNERSVLALNELCDRVEVLIPRPYVPLFISSCVPRWKIYALTPRIEVRNGVCVHRPAYPQIPKIGGALWIDSATFLFCRSVARKLHQSVRFDAILSYDLLGAGGLAWRIGRDLQIPAAGWATGGDLNITASSSYGRAVVRTLRNLDLVFYQSRELLVKAAQLLGGTPDEIFDDRHTVLPRGIAMSPCLCRAETRHRIRAELGFAEEQVLVLNVGRLHREKGTFDLIDSICLAAARDPRLICIFLGSYPAFDQTVAVQAYLDNIPALKKRVKLLPACPQDKVWEYLCAADIFAFTSHHEGMPNSLLEAMAMGLPAIAFAIPPVVEIKGDTEALVTIPVFRRDMFAEAILRLADSAVEKSRIAEIGKRRVMQCFMVKKNTATALSRLAQEVKATRTCGEARTL